MTKQESKAQGDDLHRLLFEPNIRINDPIDNKVLADFLGELAEVRSSGQHLVMELNTIGGDPDISRRIAHEVRLFAAHSGRSAVCVGKTYVYSAGINILAGFRKSCRYLTEDAILLVHERQLENVSLSLSGPLASAIQIVQEELSLLETSRKLENEGFAELVEGSRLTVEELRKCIRANCYMTAQQFLDHGLVEKILR